MLERIKTAAVKVRGRIFEGINLKTAVHLAARKLYARYNHDHHARIWRALVEGRD